MATLKSTFKRYNGTDWDIHYFETSADLINETATYKVLTADERTAISTYLVTFNAADKLVKLDANGEIPVGLIPGGLDYLTVNNPTFTGDLTGNSIRSVDSQNLTIVRRGGAGQNTYGGGLVLQNEKIIFEIGQGQGGVFEYRADQQQGYGVLDLSGVNTLTGLVAPVNASDAATKAYVDSVAVMGISVAGPVQAATTANITLSGTQTIDGIAVDTGFRVLVKNQSTASQNGIYEVQSGAWTLVEETEDNDIGTLVFVEEGTQNNDSQWYKATATTWVLFSRVDTITAGAGLTKTGTQLSIANGAITNAMLNGDINQTKILDFVADKTASAEQDWGNGSTGFGLKDHIDQTARFLNQLRGDSAANLTDTLPITLANAALKNRTFVVAANPANTGFVSGDIALQTLA